MGYQALLHNVKDRIRAAQVKAAVAAFSRGQHHSGVRFLECRGYPLETCSGGARRATSHHLFRSGLAAYRGWPVARVNGCSASDSQP
jgi:hypothetical protein